MKRTLYILAISLSSLVAAAQDFENNPHIDVARALMGRVAGLDVSAGSGTSYDNYSSLAVHGRTPLILVDGFPRDLRHITSLEVEKVELLTDAVSCALWGVRGGNGVLNITTKRAESGRLKVRANYQYGLNTPWRQPEYVDSFRYAEILNSAMVSDGLEPRYSLRELDAFATGRYPYAYPNVDWWSQVYKDVSHNHRVNLTFEGGNEKFRYYTVADYMHDTGLFRNTVTDSRYRTDNTDIRLNLRTNMDVALTRTTTMKLGVLAKFQEYSQAQFGNIYSQLYTLPSAAFPVRHVNGMYGANSLYPGKNPVAMLMDSGNRKLITGAMNANLSLTQDLGIITEGLSVELAVAFDDIGTMTETISKSYMSRELIPSIADDGTLIAVRNDIGDGSKVLNHSSGFYSLYMRFDMNAKLMWDRTFDKHRLSAGMLYDIQSYTANGRNNSTKRMTASAIASYIYDNRYKIDAIASWSGSAYLKPGAKFNFYPAVSTAWIASNEGFLKGAEKLDRLELAVSFGYAGWDGNMTHELYLPSFGSSGAQGYYFSDGTYSYGVKEGPLPVETLVPERVMRVNGRIETDAFGKKLNFSVNGFYEKVSNILVNASSVVSGVLGINPGKQCAGVNDWMGADLSLSWNDIRGDFSYGAYANVSYLTSKVIEDGQEFQRYDYLLHKGNPVGQCYGLEAEGFFTGTNDIRNTVTHTFAIVKPGDIKYVDQNADFKITEEDVVPLGYSTIPLWTFGFGLNIGYKGVKLSAQFQGCAGVTLNMLNSPLYKPLIGNTAISETFLKMEIPWSQQTAETATVPRLTTLSNANNYRNSSVWYRDGSFLKLRDVTLSYTFPKKWLRFADMEIWIKGTDLFSADALGLIDPECITASYPSLRTWWAGVRFNF